MLLVFFSLRVPLEISNLLTLLPPMVQSSHHIPNGLCPSSSLGNTGSNCSSFYIDKTEIIYNLLKTKKRVLISSPRRFGKTLTLDTIGTLFEKGV